MKILFFLIKKIVMSICILYAINLIIVSVGVIIPINVISILSVAILGIPALFGLFIIEKLI